MSTGQKNSFSQLSREVVGNLLYCLPKQTARSIWFFVQHGYKMDFDNPKTLDEKLNWLLANYLDREHGRYVDKIAVRDFVSGKGLEDILPHVYGVWYRGADIPLDSLPDQFVLKCNHASGDQCYEIVRDKGTVDWPAVLKRLDKMTHRNYGRSHCEYQYGSIRPCIYAEELLDDGRDSRITDYKVYCFYGKPHCIMVCIGRGHDLKRMFFDTDWRYLDYTRDVFSDIEIERPAGLDRMLEASAVLAQQFPFARMDFYDVGGKVYFGEITLTPDNCNSKHLNTGGQELLGSLLDIEPVRKSKGKVDLPMDGPGES